MKNDDFNCEVVLRDSSGYEHRIEGIIRARNSLTCSVEISDTVHDFRIFDVYPFAPITE